MFWPGFRIHRIESWKIRQILLKFALVIAQPHEGLKNLTLWRKKDCCKYETLCYALLAQGF
jgi:hypothetical protein